MQSHTNLPEPPPSAQPPSPCALAYLPQPPMASDSLEFSSLAERAEELVRFLGAADEALLARLAALLPGGHYGQLVTAILAAQADIFRVHSDSDVEGVFTLILSLLGSLQPTEHDAALDAIAEAVTCATDKRSVEGGCFVSTT